MKLGVVAALPQELSPTLRAIPTAARTVDGLRFRESPALVFVAGGVGSRPAAAAALLLADTFRPDALVSVGFSGALVEDLVTADVVVGGTTGHPATPSLAALARSCLGKPRQGAVLSVPKVVVDAAEKKELAKTSGALVIDMEAEAVAVAARARGLGFLAVKVVLDTPQAPLASTYAGVWTVLRELVLRPGSILAMAYDAKRVKLAAERLKDFFVALEGALKTGRPGAD